MLAEVAGPDQRQAEKMRPGNCTKKLHPAGVLGWPFWGPIHHLPEATLPCWKNTCEKAIVFPSQSQFTRANPAHAPKFTTPGLSGWIFFVHCPGLIFLATRWSGPATSASMFSVFLDYILWVCTSLWDSFLYLRKLHWFLYLLLSYFCHHDMFIFRWSSNFVEKRCVEREHGGEDGISCLLAFQYIIIVYQ